MFEKQPNTDIERVACLAYFLTHYRDTPHFKTLDISKINTEAAQIKFSNAAQAVENATKAGLIVQSLKGQKQLSAIGEQYVQALPVGKKRARQSLALNPVGPVQKANPAIRQTTKANKSQQSTREYLYQRTASAGSALGGF